MCVNTSPVSGKPTRRLPPARALRKQPGDRIVDETNNDTIWLVVLCCVVSCCVFFVSAFLQIGDTARQKNALTAGAYQVESAEVLALDGEGMDVAAAVRTKSFFGKVGVCA